jgi:hypothetical protein
MTLRSRSRENTGRNTAFVGNEDESRQKDKSVMIWTIEVKNSKFIILQQAINKISAGFHQPAY